MLGKLRRATSSESGFTLVELLVVMVILGVIGGIVGSAVLTSLRSSTATQLRIEARQELEIAMQQMTRELRGARSLRVPSDGDETFIGAVTLPPGTQTERFSYFIVDTDSGRLLQCVGENCRADDPAQRTLVTTIDNDLDSEPVFVYFNQDGGETSQRASAALVRIRLMRTLQDGRDPVIVETRVAVRSARYQSS